MTRCKRSSWAIVKYSTEPPVHTYIHIYIYICVCVCVCVCVEKKITCCKILPYNRPRRPRGGGEYYNSTLSSTSALDWVGGQRHASAALSQGKTRYPLYRKLGCPPLLVWTGAEELSPSGFDPRTVQPVVSLYTD